MRHKRLSKTISASEKLASLSPQAFVVWTYLLPQTDWFGRYPADPNFIKAQALPRYPLDEGWVSRAIEEMAAVGLIHLYQVKRKSYFVLHDVEEWSPPSGRVKESAGEWPAPPEDLCPCVLRARKETVHPSASGVEWPNLPVQHPELRVEPTFLSSPSHPEKPTVSPSRNGARSNDHENSEVSGGFRRSRQNVGRCGTTSTSISTSTSTSKEDEPNVESSKNANHKKRQKKPSPEDEKTQELTHWVTHIIQEWRMMRDPGVPFTAAEREIKHLVGRCHVPKDVIEKAARSTDRGHVDFWTEIRTIRKQWARPPTSGTNGVGDKLMNHFGGESTKKKPRVKLKPDEEICALAMAERPHQPSREILLPEIRKALDRKIDPQTLRALATDPNKRFESFLTNVQDLLEAQTKAKEGKRSKS